MRNQSRQHRIGAALLAAPILVLLAFISDRLAAQTPAEAFKRGCGGGCHASDAAIVRRIRKEPEVERRAWIESFMTLHPCASDDLKPVIVEYLLERSAALTSLFRYHGNSVLFAPNSPDQEQLTSAFCKKIPDRSVATGFSSSARILPARWPTAEACCVVLPSQGASSVYRTAPRAIGSIRATRILPAEQSV